jgi:hypothetical protein
VLVGAHAAHVNPTPSVAGATQPSGGVFKPIACIECHPNNATNNHGNGAVNFTFAGATGANLNTFTPTFTQGNGTTATTCATYCHGAKLPNGSAGSTSMAWNGAATTCTSCHGFPPASHAAMTNATQCATCHSETVTATGTINIALGKHINGVVDGGGEPPNGGSSCGGCHTTFFNQMTAVTGLPVSRHGLGSDVPTDSGADWATPATLSAVTQTNRSCVNMCHGDHPHDLTSPLTTTHDNNVYLDATTSALRGSGSANRIGSGTSQNRARTDFDSVQNKGLCSSCHQKAIVANGIVVGALNFGASAHDFTTNTAGANNYTWTYPIHDGSTFQRNCTKCHATRDEGRTPTATSTQAVHYSTTDANLLAGTGSAQTGNFVCYNCHATSPTTLNAPANLAQGNRSGKDVQAEVGKLHNHPIATTDSLHNSLTEATATFKSGTLTGTNRHVACIDCHDPHEAGKTLRTYPTTGTMTSTRNQIIAAGPLVGATGVTYAAPTAYTTGTIVIATTTGVVTGTGTTWTATNAAPGSNLFAGNRWYTITAFSSATSLTVTPAVAVAAGATYKIVPNSAAANFSTNPVALAAGAGEYQLCFKCHSAFAFGAGMPVTGGTTYVTGTAAFTSGSNTVTGTSTVWTSNHVGWVIKNNADGAWYRVMSYVSATSLRLDRVAAATVSGAYTLQQGALDIADEFSPNNASGHPVITGLANYAGSATPKALTTSQMAVPWNAAGVSASGTGVGYQTMACTDCHAGDAASPAVQGPHGSATSFLLRGASTKLAWPNLLLTSAPYATSFCSNCHTWSASSPSAHPHGAPGEHAAARCYNCHIVVPHGGKLARLIGDADSPNMPSRYAYQGSKANLFVIGYTKPTAGYSKGNCSANGSCSTHSSTANQNW